MKIGILETGLLREELAPRFDPYPVMFERLINLSGYEFKFESFSVIRAEMPESIYDCDGWLITGSRHGVYENLEWMRLLQDFIRELAKAGVPLIGVCFGHQIIAQALGGEVVKSDKGWSVGPQRYRIDQAPSWMKGKPQSVDIYAYHQDQIETLPPSAQVFSSSDFCPYAGLTYGDSIISVQAHPEIEEAYERALLEAYGGTVVPAVVADEALGLMNRGASVDAELVANWFAEFFLSRQSQSQSRQQV
jgi:GMP synthase-like glutamine amidotransferase